ncbi:28S ribosomal protein S23, mitochondrial [Colossoma macropomum]|uniref:28S ribosomal protein S23, mitochondrial n=1 Tax=Colossoma macropomum TaxID=42526 RepID=UPI0018654FC3|nr:28S ribosomal protein S23, mitochondrial [Colossoma macropomum]
MAGSRLEKFGTVFTRVRDLMRSGVIKESDKPLWFDVYAAFPPKRDPLYVRPSKSLRPQKKEDPVPEIFYKEDEIRAKFFEMYGSGPKAFDLTKTNFVSTCQRFVEKYSELESRGDVKPEMLFEETGKALLAEGIVLRRRGGPAVAAEQTNPLLGMELAEMLAEQQKHTAIKTQAPEEQAQTVTTDSSTASQ